MKVKEFVIQCQLTKPVIQYWKEYLAICISFASLYLHFLSEYGRKYLYIKSVDLPSFWCAVEATFDHSLSPYNREVLQGLFTTQHVYPYLYPPPSLLAYFPLSLLSYEHAKITVLAINHALILLLLWLLLVRLMKLTPKKDTLEIIVSFCFILSFNPIMVLLNHGQVNLLMACSLLVFWILVRLNRSFWASIFLVTAIILKTYPVLLIPFLIVCKKYKTVSFSIVLLIGILIVSLVLLPAELWKDWLINVLPTGGYANTPKDLFPPTSLFNQNLNGFFSRMFVKTLWSPNPLIESPILAKIFIYFTGGVFFLISLYAVYLRHQKNAEYAIDWTMLIVMPLMYLISPLSWEHHQVYILASIVILIVAIFQGRIESLAISFFIVLSAFVIRQEIVHFKFFAILCLWYVSVWLAFQTKHSFLLRSPSGRYTQGSRMLE